MQVDRCKALLATPMAHCVQKKGTFLAAQPRTGNCVVDLLVFRAVTNDVAG